MAFKMVTDSEKAAGRIAGTALAFAESIAGEQSAKWRDRLGDGQAVVNVEQHQRFHAEELLRLRKDLRHKEAAHLDRLKKINEAREWRDGAIPRMRQVLYAVRDVFQGIYGEKGRRALFSEKPDVPADATPLRRVAHRIAGKLRDENLELPEPILRVPGLSRADLAEDVEKPLKVLSAAMQELEDMLPLANQTLEAKHEAHAAVDQKSARLARYLEGLYELEGHDVLAAKVRPSSHRSKKESADAAASEDGARADEDRGRKGATPEPAARESATETPVPVSEVARGSASRRSAVPAAGKSISDLRPS